MNPLTSSSLMGLGIISIFIIIAILPTLLYVALKRPKDDGSGGGTFGYYLIKLLRRLR